MEIEVLDHTDDHQPTVLADVIAALVGEEVVVFGHYAITGKLIAYNGFLLHVRDANNSIRDYYIVSHSVQAIAKRSETDLL